MLVNLKEILKIAEEKNIAIGAFNVTSIDACRAVIQAAEEMNSPVIIQFAECHECYTRLEDIAPVMVRNAKIAEVPVCVHLDHGDHVSYLKKALELGFTGVMIDMSDLPFDENVKITKEVVEMARQYGASVEAELGSMGRRETGRGDQSGDEDPTKIYTDPDLAAKFVKLTGIDALACSFGTTHGIYLKEPKLNFDILKRTRDNVGLIPIVMHGGSGVGEEDVHKSIDAGVRKINCFTYVDKAVGQEMKDEANRDLIPFASELNLKGRKVMVEEVKKCIKMYLNQK